MRVSPAHQNDQYVQSIRDCSFTCSLSIGKWAIQNWLANSLLLSTVEAWNMQAYPPDSRMPLNLLSARHSSGCHSLSLSVSPKGTELTLKGAHWPQQRLLLSLTLSHSSGSLSLQREPTGVSPKGAPQESLQRDPTASQYSHLIQREPATAVAITCTHSQFLPTTVATVVTPQQRNCLTLHSAHHSSAYQSLQR